MTVTNIDDLRNARGQGDVPTEVSLSECLTVEVLLDSVEMLLYMNKIPNPLMQALIELGGDEPEQVGIEALRQKAELQDAVCGAVIVNPPWCSLAEQLEMKETRPKGKLTLGMMRDDEVGAIFAMVYGGIEGLKKFRDNRERRLATLRSNEVRPTPIADAMPDATADSTMVG